MKKYRGALGPITAVLLFLIGMRWSPFEPHGPPADPSGGASGTISWDDQDWDVFESTVSHALSEGQDTLPMGDLMATIGLGLVGTAYVPQTLEVDGPERLVVNFRGLDCVTFVENVYALARTVKSIEPERLTDRAGLEGDYERMLRSLRYRNGVIDGYASRLHYFSDWIGQNSRKGLVRDVTAELGGVLETDPINFMSTHPDAYRQLADPGVVEDVASVEAMLSGSGRHVIPEGRVADVAGEIRNGDIIAATSTVAGLDVAHTGLALWVDGELRLLHAPLVGEAVQISETSLAERLGRIDSQDGIIVARPLNF